MRPTTFLANAIAPSMLTDARSTLEIVEVTVHEARALAVDAISHVGHADTATRYAEALGRSVEANRAPLTLAVGDRLLVGQHDQSRLAEGATTLPEAARFRWLCITRTS